MSVPWLDLPMAIIDTETTGVDPKTAHVWEIGIRFRNGTRHGKRTQTLVRPPVPIPDEVVELCHLTAADLRAIDEAPTFGEVVPRLLAHLERKVLVAYNGLGYDIPLLRSELVRSALCSTPHLNILEQPIIDPLILVRELYPRMRKRGLEHVAAHFGIEIPSGPHRALADVEVTDDVLVMLSEKLPDELGDLLAFQSEAKKVQDADREQYSYWLRTRRGAFKTGDKKIEMGSLMMACGKHCGRWLHEVDRSYLRYLLEASPTWDDPLPEAVRVEFERVLEVRR